MTNKSGKTQADRGTKTSIHPRNKHQGRYDFKELIKSCPELQAFVKLNDYNDESIDFFNPEAVKMLNKALLKHFYGINYWDIPQDYLCPPIPGRADYIHHIADVLQNSRPDFLGNKVPTGRKINCLDIGIGANCVYPIVGIQDYGWSFVGSDIDLIALSSARKIVESNDVLKGRVELRHQANPENTFKRIIQKGERFDLTICNPPFHSSLEEAHAGTLRKLRNLKNKKVTQVVKNFGGKNMELWCEGGEERFTRNMIFQSKDFAWSCFWFSTMISKQTNLKNAYRALKEVGAVEVKTIAMGQGNKTSRIVVWTFLNRQQQNKWIKTRWK